MSAPISEHPSPSAAPRVAADAPGRQAWARRERPLRLERRLEFPDYETTRVFLERAGALSEEMDVFPNLSFGRTYVNLTLFADDDSGELSAEALSFAGRLDRLLAAEPPDPG